ncbi:ankyrin repeat domain-containing protein [Microbacterium sp. NPDC089696]|uniref:ankyrin repeat domain-containing protein n=1 Tax=Microbacterium sp. NPDC089696 TaxID=3364199 RepID=UPI003814BFDF
MRSARMLLLGTLATALTLGMTACAPASDPPVPEASSMSDATPDLLVAATTGDADAVRAALDAGADIEARGDGGMTALVMATKADHVEAARTLIEAGADVNAKDDIQDSAYLYAGARGHDEILRLTLDHGADLASTNRDGDGVLPHDLATARGYDAIAALLEG